MHAIDVRIAEPNDASSIASLWVRAHAARLGRTAGESEAETLRLVHERSCEPGAMFVIACDGSRTVGIGHALPARDRDGEGERIPGLLHLSMIAVEPDAWGRGVGKAIVRYLLELARERGYDRAQLWTQVSNERGKRLYGGLGFFEAGREKEGKGEIIRLYVRPLHAID